jgi:hypothetical protein
MRNTHAVLNFEGRTENDHNFCDELFVTWNSEGLTVTHMLDDGNDAGRPTEVTFRVSSTRKDDSRCIQFVKKAHEHTTSYSLRNVDDDLLSHPLRVKVDAIVFGVASVSLVTSSSSSSLNAKTVSSSCSWRPRLVQRGAPKDSNGSRTLDIPVGECCCYRMDLEAAQDWPARTFVRAWASSGSWSVPTLRIADAARQLAVVGTLDPSVVEVHNMLCSASTGVDAWTSTSTNTSMGLVALMMHPDVNLTRMADEVLPVEPDAIRAFATPDVWRAASKDFAGTPLFSAAEARGRARALALEAWFWEEEQQQKTVEAEAIQMMTPVRPDDALDECVAAA